MCKREAGEPFWAYAWRQFCERPYAVIGVLAIAGCVYMYQDLSHLMHGFLGEMQGVKSQLIELNVRISNIEQRQQLTTPTTHP